MESGGLRKKRGAEREKERIEREMGGWRERMREDGGRG